MPISELYKQTVVEHNRTPRRFGTLAGCTHAADGANPRCGDQLRVELLVHDGRIADLRFSGESCAIATAAASMLGDLLIGHDAQRLQQLRACFEQLLGADADQVADESLGELNSLRALRGFPTRHQCVLLPFATFEAALGGRSSASTETQDR